MEMESALGDFLQTVEKLVSKALAKFKFTPASLIGLDGLLSDTFIKQNPKPVDYLNRTDLVRIFNVLAQEVFGNGKILVEGYGSFIMDMFNEKSDLDLSINFINTQVDRQTKIKMLRKLTRKLQSIQKKGHVSSVLLVTTAKVPIVKLTDVGTGIECDLSIDNKDGIEKSHIIHAISGIDERFRMLCFLMKSWAKAHDINSARDRSLNSFSIVSLVAFHLQTTNPPILPSFSALLREGADPACVAAVVRNYIDYGKRNKESLAELFMTFFLKLASVEKLWQNGICVSLYEGSWIMKSWGSRSYSISIEDFTDPSQNVARAVGPDGFRAIYSCIHNSVNHLSKFLNGQMQGTDLIRLLFGAETISTPAVGVTNKKADVGLASQDSLKPRKRHFEEPLVQKKVKIQRVQGTEPKKAKIQRVQGTEPKKAKIQRVQGTEPQGISGMLQSVGRTLLNDVPTPITPPSSRQPHLAIPRTEINGIHGYAPRPAPSSLGIFHTSSRAQDSPSQSLQRFARMSHQTPVAPVGNWAIHPHVPPVSHNPYRGMSHQNAVALVGNGAIHSHPPHHQNAVPLIGNRLLHSHPPHHNSVAPIRDGAFFHSRLPHHHNPVLPIGNGQIHSFPQENHNPYRGDYTLYNHWRY